MKNRNYDKRAKSKVKTRGYQIEKITHAKGSDSPNVYMLKEERGDCLNVYMLKEEGREGVKNSVIRCARTK